MALIGDERDFVFYMSTAISQTADALPFLPCSIQVLYYALVIIKVIMK